MTVLCGQNCSASVESLVTVRFGPLLTLYAACFSRIEIIATPPSPFTSSGAAFWLSGSRLKLLAFTTTPSAQPIKLSLDLRLGP
eukprot:6255465-Amphidinium_carterae.1